MAAKQEQGLDEQTPCTDLAERTLEINQQLARYDVEFGIHKQPPCLPRADCGPRRAIARQRRIRQRRLVPPKENQSAASIDCFLENAAPDEDGSDGHHPQHGHDDADRTRGAKGRRRKQQHCNRAANGAT